MGDQGNRTRGGWRLRKEVAAMLGCSESTVKGREKAKEFARVESHGLLGTKRIWCDEFGPVLAGAMVLAGTPAPQAVEKGTTITDAATNSTALGRVEGDAQAPEVLSAVVVPAERVTRTDQALLAILNSLREGLRYLTGAVVFVGVCLLLVGGILAYAVWPRQTRA